MRVLMINSVCGIRSTGRICTDLADALTQKGHKVKIAYGRECVPEQYKKYAVRIGNDLGIKFHGLQSRVFDNTGFGSKEATKKFLRWADKFNPDVLHLHNLHGYYINIELLFNWIKSRPDMKVIWTLHDCWAFTGHCSHFSYVKCDKWKKGCCKCSQVREYPASFGYDNSYYNWKKKRELFTGVKKMVIVTPSKWLAKLVEQSFLKEYPIEVIHNGIDLSYFKPSENDFKKNNNLNNKKIILGVASSWNSKKGLDDFCKLAKELNNDYKIVLVGLSKKQIKRIPNNILGIMRTNSIQELAEIYSSADVFLNLTYEDTYPTVNLESQACNTPVITYRTGGSVESVPEQNIVDVGQINQLIDKIKSKCQVKIDKTFDKKEAYREYICLY